MPQSPAPDAAAGGLAAPQPATPDSPAARAQAQPLGSGFRFRVAPIRWSGDLGDSVSWSTFADEPRRFQHVQTANLRGATYVWQPWFAQLAARVGIVSGTETNPSGIISESGSSRRTTSITGGASLALFPSSRFPFNASFDRSDSRESGVFASQDFTNTRYSLRQDYTLPSGRTSFSGAYDRSVVESGNTGRDTVDALRATASHRLDKHSFQFTGSHSANRAENSGNRFVFDNLSLRHTWQPDPFLSLDSNLFVSRSDSRASGDGLDFANTSNFLDLSSFANWLPDTEKPMTVTGNVRLFRQSTEAGLGTSETQSMSAGVNTTYSLSKNISLSGNVQVAQIRSGDTSSLITIVGGGAGYSSDLITLGKFTYTWNASANGSFISGSDDGNQTLLNANAGHNLSRTLWSEERSTLSISLGQGAGVSQAGDLGSQLTLSHSANATWMLRQSDSFISTFTAGASDTRSSGDNASSFQQINLTASGNMLFSRYSTGTANLSMVGLRQDIDNDSFASASAPGFDSGSDDNRMRWTLQGTLNYQHGRAFGVPRLRYSATYTANALDLNSRRQGNVDAVTDRVSHALEQRLDYRIGRLDLRGLLRVGTIDGKKNALLFIRVNREFGSF